MSEIPTRAQMITRYLTTLVLAYNAGRRDREFLKSVAPSFRGTRVYMQDDLQEAWVKGWDSV